MRAFSSPVARVARYGVDTRTRTPYIPGRRGLDSPPAALPRRPSTSRECGKQSNWLSFLLHKRWAFLWWLWWFLANISRFQFNIDDMIPNKIWWNHSEKYVINCFSRSFRYQTFENTLRFDNSLWIPVDIMITIASTIFLHSSWGPDSSCLY